MTLYVDPKHVVWDDFGELEPPKPEWVEQFPYWQDYVEKFFLSNGMTFSDADSNVEQWLMAPDRAPFAEMVRQLLPRLAGRTDLSGTEAVLFSHWLPDLHMGTSVTNFIMHQLGLSNCFGFAISDRGLSAPFFAFDTLYKYLMTKHGTGLLVIADQKHLLYKSALVSRLKPRNTATIVQLDPNNTKGFEYRGYVRHTLGQANEATRMLTEVIAGFDLDRENLTVIGPKSLLRDAHLSDVRVIETDESLICSAPFAAFAAEPDLAQDYVLLCQDDLRVTALGFRGRTS